MTKEQTRMLAYLTEHVGSWVNARELTPIACAYCRVIRELRAMGHHIANRVERDGRKTRAGFYMLCTPRQVAAFAIGAGEPVKPEQIAAAMKDDAQPNLFSEPLPERHRDNG